MHMTSRKTRSNALIALLAGLFFACLSGLVAAQSRPLPVGDDVWRLLANAQGIDFNGTPSAQPRVHILCDVHCPACARLFVKLEKDYPEVRVRWVPIAYFQPDSSSLAASILQGSHPAVALDRNYRLYDFDLRRGAAVPDGGALLGYQNGLLQEAWMKLGGFTPMLFVEDPAGRRFRGNAGTPAALRRMVETMQAGGDLE